MKRLFVTLAIAFSLISFSSFANNSKTINNDSDVTPAAVNSFKTSFSNATDVSWSISENYFKAEFTLNGQFVTAFFDAEGKMIALTRNISSLQLPIVLQTGLKKSYENFWISDLFEMASADSGTTYYVTVENGDSKVTLKSSGSDWTVYQKQKK